MLEQAFWLKSYRNLSVYYVYIVVEFWIVSGWSLGIVALWSIGGLELSRFAYVYDIDWNLIEIHYYLGIVSNPSNLIVK